MSGALTRSQLLAFEQQIGEQLVQLQQEACDQLEGMPDQSGVGLQGALAREIAACHDALMKIERGRFGCCDSCGEVIELNHLMADPITSCCVSCRRKALRLPSACP